MPDMRITPILLWLVTIGVAVYLIERLAVVTSILAGPILMFTCAWLIALIIEPVFIVLQKVHLPRVWVVFAVYLTLLVLIVVLVIAVIPVISNQVDGFVQNLPAGVEQMQRLIITLQLQLERIGIQSDMRNELRIESLFSQFGNLGATAVQQSLGVAGGIAQLLFNVFIVLILSVYIALDGQTLFRKFVVLCPADWRDEVEAFGQIMTSTFGGFMRTQILSSLVYSLMNAIVMRFFDLPSITLVTMFVAIALMVPVVGGMIALIPPTLIIVLNQTHMIIPYLIIMLVIQQVLFHMVLPRIMGRAVGLHPLLVFGALLIGGVIAGPWGGLFGIPLAGVAAAIANYVYVRRMATAEQ
ncbi:MAG: AI-2E family transporter [Roseiflexaceae bacterium]